MSLQVGDWVRVKTQNGKFLGQEAQIIGRVARKHYFHVSWGIWDAWYYAEELERVNALEALAKVAE